MRSTFKIQLFNDTSICGNAESATAYAEPLVDCWIIHKGLPWAIYDATVVNVYDYKWGPCVL